MLTGLLGNATLALRCSHVHAGWIRELLVITKQSEGVVGSCVPRPASQVYKAIKAIKAILSAARADRPRRQYFAGRPADVQAGGQVQAGMGRRAGGQVGF